MRGLLVASLVLLQAFPAPGLAGEHRQSDHHAWCRSSGACYSVHLASRTFSGAKEACSVYGGVLSTASGEAEIQALSALLRQAVSGPGGGPSVFWLGLVRKPPQCTYQELPLRGFSWAFAGLQEPGPNETVATPSWVKEPSMSCTTEKCAGLQVMTGDPHSQAWGLKERSCTKSSPGYICKYRYEGMCPAVHPPGAQGLHYVLPSHLQSSDLAFSPLGTVLTLRCPTQEVQLTCQASPNGYHWEGAERGLCSCLSGYWSPGQQRCVEAAACLDDQGAFSCVCAWGFHWAVEKRACLADETDIAAGTHGPLTPTASGALPSSDASHSWNRSSSEVSLPSAESNSSAPVEYPEESYNYIFIPITLAVVLLVILVMASLQVFKACFKTCSSKGAQAGKEPAPATAPGKDPEQASATGTSSEHSLGPSRADSAEASQRDSEARDGNEELEQP